MEEITTVQWRAFDGTMFDDDSECIEYEDNRLARLAKEKNIIFLDRNRDHIEPREVEHCEYLYVPDNKTYDLISQIFDLYELYSPFSAAQNDYGEEFEEDNPDICGWWVLDNETDKWHNLHIEARAIEQMSTDLEQLTGVV